MQSEHQKYLILDNDYTLSKFHLHSECIDILVKFLNSSNNANSELFKEFKSLVTPPINDTSVSQALAGKKIVWSEKEEEYLWDVLNLKNLIATAGNEQDWRDLLIANIDNGVKVSIASFNSFPGIVKKLIKQEIFNQDGDDKYFDQMHFEVWFPTDTSDKNAHIDNIVNGRPLNNTERKSLYKNIILCDDTRNNTDAVTEITNNFENGIYLPKGIENSEEIGNANNPRVIKTNLVSNKFIGENFQFTSDKEENKAPKIIQNNKNDLAHWVSMSSSTKQIHRYKEKLKKAGDYFIRPSSIQGTVVLTIKPTMKDSPVEIRLRIKNDVFYIEPDGKHPIFSISENIEAFKCLKDEDLKNFVDKKSIDDGSYSKKMLPGDIIISHTGGANFNATQAVENELKEIELYSSEFTYNITKKNYGYADDDKPILSITQYMNEQEIELEALEELEQVAVKEKGTSLPEWASNLITEVGKIENISTQIPHPSPENIYKIKQWAQGQLTILSDLEKYITSDVSNISATYDPLNDSVIISTEFTYLKDPVKFSVTKETYLKTISPENKKFYAQEHNKFFGQVRDKWKPEADPKKLLTKKGEYFFRPSNKGDSFITLSINTELRHSTPISNYRFEMRERGIYTAGGKHPIDLTPQNIEYISLLRFTDTDNFSAKKIDPNQMQEGEIVITPKRDEVTDEIIFEAMKKNGNVFTTKTFIPQEDGSYKIKNDANSHFAEHVTSISESMEIIKPAWVRELEYHLKTFQYKASQNNQSLIGTDLNNFNELLKSINKEPILEDKRHFDKIKNLTIKYNYEKKEVMITVHQVYSEQETKTITLTRDDFLQRKKVLDPLPQIPANENSMPKKNKSFFKFSLFNKLGKIIDNHYQKKWEKEFNNQNNDPIELIKKCVGYNPSKKEKYLNNDKTEKDKIRSILSKNSFEDDTNKILGEINKLAPLKNTSLRTLMEVINNHQPIPMQSNNRSSH